MAALASFFVDKDVSGGSRRAKEDTVLALRADILALRDELRQQAKAPTIDPEKSG